MKQNDVFCCTLQTQKTTLLLERDDSDDDENDYSKTAVSGTLLTLVLLKIILHAALKCDVSATTGNMRSEEQI